MIKANENGYIISDPTDGRKQSLLTLPMGNAVDKQLLLGKNSLLSSFLTPHRGCKRCMVSFSFHREETVWLKSI